MFLSCVSKEFDLEYLFGATGLHKNTKLQFEVNFPMYVSSTMGYFSQKQS